MTVFTRFEWSISVLSNVISLCLIGEITPAECLPIYYITKAVILIVR